MSALSFSPQSPPVVLVTFDGSGTDRSWRVTDDPVMGGQSKSSFAVQDGVGKFSGTCAIVPFLKAPGFCNVGTTHGLFTPAKFADASAFIHGSLYLTLKSSTPTYTGFKVDFGAKNLTRPSGSLSHGGAALKANIEIPAGLKADASGFVTIKVPFSSFSVDWSDYTGECDTKVRTPPPPGKVWAGGLPIGGTRTAQPSGLTCAARHTVCAQDPSGYQHLCCDSTHPEVCPQAHHLASISSFMVWVEQLGHSANSRAVVGTWGHTRHMESWQGRGPY